MTETVKLILGVSGSGSYKQVTINLIAEDLAFYAVIDTYKAIVALNLLENSVIKHVGSHLPLSPSVRYIELECPDGTIELLRMLQDLPNHVYKQLIGIQRDSLKEKILPIYLARSLTKPK
jgi:hypothetical protein